VGRSPDPLALEAASACLLSRDVPLQLPHVSCGQVDKVGLVKDQLSSLIVKGNSQTVLRNPQSVKLSNRSDEVGLDYLIDRSIYQPDPTLKAAWNRSDIGSRR
jgi:hypothetical protein